MLSTQLLEAWYSSEKDDSAISLVILLVFVFVVLFAIIYLIYHGTLVKKRRQILGGYDAQTYSHITVNAAVINKSNGVPGAVNPYDSLTFQFESGERMEFFVENKAFFNQVVVGDKGSLTYAGRALINFIRQ